MGIWDTIANAFRSPVSEARTVIVNGDAEPPPATGPAMRAGFDAARSNRFNASQWSGVFDEPINRALASDLAVMRYRCTMEARNNGTVAGMIRSHATACVGRNGPTRQIMPVNPIRSERQRVAFEKYKIEAQQIASDWFAAPDYNEQLTGVEMLRLWVRQLWTSGEALSQQLTVRGFNRRTAVALRLLNLEARQIDNPASGPGENICLGIQTDSKGKKLRYFVRDIEQAFASPSLTGVPIPADLITHVYEVHEPNQLRGIPFLQYVLSDVADLRDYDAAVMKAAQAAASVALAVTSTDKDATTKPRASFASGASVQIPWGRMWQLPALTDLKQVDGKQPQQQYVEYRKERTSTFGLPAQMPGMVTRQSAENHNYSSARIDRQDFQMSCDTVQGLIDSHLIPLEMQVLNEAQRSRAIRPAPMPVRMEHRWPRLPHVDPVKEAKARTEDLDNKSKTLHDIWNETGKPPEQAELELREEFDMFERIHSGLGGVVFGVNTTRNASVQVDPDEVAETTAEEIANV